MKRTFIKIALFSAIVPLVLSSCASIFSKSSYPVTIQSTPSDAKISIVNNKGVEVYSGKTPTTVKLKSSSGFFSKASYTVTFSSPGYNDKVAYIGSKIDGWYFGNILLGGLIGMLIVDPATGAMWTIDTEYINAELDSSYSTSERSLQIMDVNDLSDSQKEKLVKLN